MVRLVSSQYGQILADRRGQALYLFTRENGPRSQCYGACANRWPPVRARGKLVAGSGTQRRLLGTARRTDGTLQLTYAGHRLYYFDADGPGRVLCQGAEEFGGLWLVLGGRGQPVK